MVKRSLILLLLLLIMQIKLSAQQVPSFTQYMDNLFILNPAAAGAFGITTFNLLSRQQLVGIDGAPSSNTFSVDGRMLKKHWLFKKLFSGSGEGTSSGSVGQGGLVYTDHNGLIRRTGIQYAYAYHISVGTTQISGGISAQVYQMQVNRSAAIGTSDYDPLLLSYGNIWVPDFNVGIFLTHRAFFAGISANSLSESALKLGVSSQNNYSLLRYYYVVAGYIFTTDRYKIEPSVLYKTTGQLGNEVDFTTRVTYRNSFWIGLGGRSNGDIMAMVGVIVKRWYIGYAFDYGTTTFKLTSYGTHEISISYKLGNSAKRLKWMERY
jgi:type IX secretion system PorP/SprF family membrane protein